MEEYLHWIVFAAGFFAAIINAIAGGGTMLTFPALLAVGISPVLANTTSAVALFAGIPGGVWANRAHLAKVKDWILPMGIVSLLGGVVGSVALIYLPEVIFEGIVPWLVLLATVLFCCSGWAKKWVEKRASGGASAGGAVFKSPEKPSKVALCIQALIAIYGGYFGAGIGIMMLAGLGFMGLKDMYGMNALKLVLAALANLACVVFFTATQMVDWASALWLLAGSIPGYFLGGYVAQWIPAIAVRVFVALVGVVIAIVLLRG